MNIDGMLSSESKTEAIQMAIEIIEVELYAQLLTISIDPDFFEVDEEITISYFGEIPENLSSSEFIAYNAIPRLVNRRLALIAKLQEINNA
jgi:hypothetical protein